MRATLTVGAAAAETGWSARMLRYLERARARRPVPDRRPDTGSTGWPS